MQVQKQIPSQNKFIKIKLRLSPNHALEINYFSKPMGKDMTKKLFSYASLIAKLLFSELNVYLYSISKYLRLRIGSKTSLSIFEL